MQKDMFQKKKTKKKYGSWKVDNIYTSCKKKNLWYFLQNCYSFLYMFDLIFSCKIGNLVKVKIN